MLTELKPITTPSTGARRDQPDETNLTCSTAAGRLGSNKNENIRVSVYCQRISTGERGSDAQNEEAGF